MLELRAVTKRFGDRLAVDDLSFTVPVGRVVGLLGLTFAAAFLLPLRARPEE